MSKQDGYSSRTAADLERKYNFGKTFAEVYDLVSDAQRAAQEASNAVDNLTHEEIFNRLTNYGEWEGIYRDDDDNIYINASYIQGGTIKAGVVEVEAASITGELVASQINTKNLKVSAANITGQLSASKIDVGELEALGLTAMYLQGSHVGLTIPDDDETVEIGGIDISGTLTGYGLEIYTYDGGIRVEAGGNVYIASGFDTSLLLDDEGAKIGPDLYLSNGTQITSDRNLKHDIEYDISAYDAVFDGLRPCRFKYNDGKSDRFHTALIAQDVEDAVLSAGLTTKDFAGFCSRPVYALDEDGNKTAEVIGETCSLRYDEFIALLIWQVQGLKARVAELEGKANE